MLILVFVLVFAAVSVSAVTVCGNNIVENSEECEFDNQCGFNEVCNECSCETPELTFTQAKFDLEIVHNLMFNKVIQLFHIVKDQLFQLEFKMLEVQLANNPCDAQSVSSSLPIETYPYAKLNEIGEMLNLILASWDKVENVNLVFGDGSVGRRGQAESFIQTAEFSSDLKTKKECYCDAYKLLADIENTPTCPVT